MTNGKFETRNEKAESEPMIICRTEEGFRVYSASQPKTSYVVSGTHEAPVCTCLDFQYHEGDPGWQCKHITAVLNSLNRRTVESIEEVEERLAIQNESNLPEKKSDRIEANGPAQMLIKRSVSPDGRIDSLSVEFSCPVENTSVGEIRVKAAKTLQLQSEIVETFLNVNRNGNTQRRNEENRDASPIGAKMLDIAGIDGR